MIGSRFGRLTVVGVSSHTDDRNRTFYDCICDCGGRSSPKGTPLKAGKILSCGCLRLEAVRARHTTHGMSRSLEYRRWAAMLQRCCNPRHEKYSTYGGAGIRVARSWKVFENFFKDMGEVPSSKHQIERSNNKKGYNPGNCIWATASKNMRNRSLSVKVKYKGKIMPILDACEAAEVSYEMVRGRIRRGWEESDLWLPSLKQKKEAA